MCVNSTSLSRQRIRIHGEIMVVRRDLDLPRLQLLDRMIPAMMSKLQLERLASESDPTLADVPGKFQKSAAAP